MKLCPSRETSKSGGYQRPVCIRYNFRRTVTPLALALRLAGKPICGRKRHEIHSLLVGCRLAAVHAARHHSAPSPLVSSRRLMIPTISGSLGQVRALEHPRRFRCQCCICENESVKRKQLVQRSRRCQPKQWSDERGLPGGVALW